uniref:AMP-dependent synthetase/ligase domain-containing protein n=1 Tax=Panagrolaimus superbus TaxID=310955 RepID=A0A914Z9L8_9BILA
MKKSPGFVAAVLELLKQEIPFVYLHFDPLKYAWTMAKRFFVSGIISDCKLEGSAKFEEIKIFEEIFYFYNLNFCPLSSIFDTKELIFIYGTQTSGTTGEPKTVYVTKRCIYSNIRDMKEAFLNKNNGEKCCVLWSTHPSFDPSLLELLLAIESNSTLIIPPTDFDKSDNIPFYFNFLSIDFMQTTPTKLMMMSKERIKWIFQKDSPCKNLFIGGEIFPSTFLNQIITPETTVKIYNIYGVTEISCWATFSSFPIKFPQKNSEISIGSNMSDTVVEIVENGKIFIKSESRECVVNFEWNGKSHFTGDYGYEKDGEIYISGRATQKIKGLKPTNEIQEYILKKYASIFEVINVLKSDIPSTLIIIVLQNDKNELNVIEKTIEKDILESFPSRYHSSRIIAIFNSELKTTQNGDLARFVFMNFNETKIIQSENIFVKELKNINFEQKNFKTDACVEVPVVEMGEVGEKFYIFGSFSGDVYTLKSDGTLVDKKYLGSPIEVPGINFWNICGFIASTNGRICKIENNGKIKQFLKITGEIKCPIFYGKENIYIITTENMLWQIDHLSGQVDTVFIGTSSRGTPLIHNKKIYIPGIKEFVIIDQTTLLILNQIPLLNPIFTNAFLWKNFVIAICAPGEIIIVNQVWIFINLR